MKYTLTYQGKEIEIEQLPSGKFKKPPLGQFTKHGLGSTWLDNGRIPTNKEDTFSGGGFSNEKSILMNKGKQVYEKGMGFRDDTSKGRFPANLLVSDDVLNDGRIIFSKSNLMQPDPPKDNRGTWQMSPRKEARIRGVDDSGSFSRYFDLDKWWTERIKLLPESVQKTFPFLIVSKASKSEKNKGCEDLPDVGGKAGEITARGNTNPTCAKCGGDKYPRLLERDTFCHCEVPEWKIPQNLPTKNSHPTVKPLKLMSYLITLGSREGDIVLDPFMGSGTTGVACGLFNRDFIGCELNEDYYKIAQARINTLQVVCVGLLIR